MKAPVSSGRQMTMSADWSGSDLMLFLGSAVGALLLAVGTLSPIDEVGPAAFLCLLGVTWAATYTTVMGLPGRSGWGLRLLAGSSATLLVAIFFVFSYSGSVFPLGITVVTLMSGAATRSGLSHLRAAGAMLVAIAAVVALLFAE